MVHFVGIYYTNMFQNPLRQTEVQSDNIDHTAECCGRCVGLCHTVWNARANVYRRELQYRLILSRYDAFLTAWVGHCCVELQDDCHSQIGKDVKDNSCAILIKIYYHSICLGLRKTTKKPVHQCRSADRGSKHSSFRIFATGVTSQPGWTLPGFSVVTTHSWCRLLNSSYVGPTRWSN